MEAHNKPPIWQPPIWQPPITEQPISFKKTVPQSKEKKSRFTIGMRSSTTEKTNKIKTLIELFQLNITEPKLKSIIILNTKKKELEQLKEEQPLVASIYQDKLVIKRTFSYPVKNESEKRKITQEVTVQKSFKSAANSETAKLIHLLNLKPKLPKEYPKKIEKALNEKNMSELEKIANSLEENKTEPSLNNMPAEEGKERREIIACLRSIVNSITAEKKAGKAWKTTRHDRAIAAQGHKNPGANTLSKKYAPAVPNTWTQRLSFDHGREKYYFLRSGMMTDHRDGTTSLLDLKTSIETLKALKEDRKPEEKDLHQLGTNLKAMGLELPTQSGMSNDMVKLINELKIKLEEREHVTDSMMAQKMQTHFNNYMSELVEQLGESYSEVNVLGSIQVMQMSLLYAEKKTAFYKGNYVQNEGRHLRDNVCIWEKFNNKELIIEDGIVGPFVDNDGKVHLKMPEGYNNISDEIKDKLSNGKLKLSTILYNISPQGLTKNKGAQVVINNKAVKQQMERLRKYKKKLKTRIKNNDGNVEKLDEKVKAVSEKIKKLEGLKERLDKGESSFELAADISIFSMPIGPVGGNCESGKDRTGYLVAVIEDKLAESVMKEMDVPKSIRITFHKFTFKMALLVCTINGLHGIKLDPREVKRAPSFKLFKAVIKAQF